MQDKTKTYHIFFGNLSSASRVEIIAKLKDKDMSVSELARKMKIEQSKLSHSLAKLRSCNLVNFKSKGKERIYYLNKRTMLPILKIIDNHSNNFCGGNCANCKIAH